MALPRYDLTDLRLFANVAEAGSLTRGAERTHLSLGAASQRIKNLEELLGTRLLERRSGGVELTDAGRALLRHAHVIGNQLNQLHGDLQTFSQGLKGRIRIFANTTAITEILPAALANYLARHLQVDIDLEERLSPEIARAVADGAVDIGILAGTSHIQGLEFIPYQRDRLMLATPHGHPLSKAGPIAFAEAIGFDFVSLHAGSAIHGFVEQVASDLGATLNLRIRVSGFEAMCRMIEAGAGIGLLPASVARRLGGSHRIDLVELTDRWAERELKICVRSRAELPAFARDLVDFLIAHASSR